MLRTLHRYRIVFLVILVGASVALAFSGFAYSWITPNRQIAAVTIDDAEITLRQVEGERRELEQLYQNQFGDNYHRVMQSLGVNLQQQALDRAIDGFLLLRAADEIGFVATAENVRNQLTAEFRGVPNARDQYAQLLLNIGLTAQEFEDRIRQGLLRAQLEQVVQDASLASERETKAVVKQERTKLQVSYLALQPADFLSQVPEPSEASLQEYYEQNASDFELPERVSYSFVALNPSKFLDLVEVFPDDVELYYTDYQARFSTEETRKIRLIELRKPAAESGDKSASDSNLNEARTKLATELEGKLAAGEAFTLLAKSHSQHESASAEGLVGELTEAQFSEKFGAPAARAVFSLASGARSSVFNDDTTSRFFQVETITPSQPIDLEKVRPEIELAIRTREAPAFLAARAAEILEEWEKSGASLSELIATGDLASRDLKVEASSPLSTVGSDPSGFSTLTERVLNARDAKRQAIDLGEVMLLVEVAEVRESEIPPFDSVKEKIVQSLKDQEAQSFAQTMAQTIVDEMQALKYPTLEAAAQSSGRSVATISEATRSSSPTPFESGELRAALFATTIPLGPPAKVFTKSGIHYVFQVTKITAPTEDEVNKELLSSRETESQQLSGVILASLLNDQKARAQIDIQPGLLGQ